ncbi:MAG: DegV family protein [Lachnospiraceae bacterium]|nr:DegV family protein [Lachnospiraceae bacterium]
MSNFIVTADTTMDLPMEVIKELDIRPIISYVSMGGDNLPDWPDITSQDLFDYVKQSGQLPKTAAANPTDYEDFFRKIREEDSRPIIHIAKSSGVSSCYENAVLASREIPDVYVVDSLGLSTGSGMLVMMAAKTDKTDPKELVAELDEFKTRIECSFVIETLDYLYKGGRCSGLAALAAGLLKLRPEIVMENGKMHAGRKFRGPYEKCLYTFIDETFKDIERFEPGILYINHTIQDRKLLEALMQHIRDFNYFEDVKEFTACAAIATHCGPNTFGFHPVRKKA